MSVNLTYLIQLQEGKNKIVRRNLSIDCDYTLIDTGTLDSENATTCDNCNKVITSYAEIKSDKIYTVGMDCLTTLLKCNSYTEAYKIAETYAKMQKELRFRAYIRKIKKLNLFNAKISEYSVQVFEGNQLKYNVRREYWNKLNIPI